MGFKSPEKILAMFLRTYPHMFTVKEMERIFKTLGMPSSESDIVQFLESSQEVLSLCNGKYITLCGAFSNEIFSIKPSSREVEQGVLVIGHRCIPFIDEDRIISSLTFYINGKKIPVKSGKFDSDFAVDKYMLFGEEYAPYLISTDEANSSLKLDEKEFELPNYVYLTGLDLDYISKHFGYKKGDRFLCCVKNWDAGKIFMTILPSGDNPFDEGEIAEKRRQWYETLENCLLESFKLHGPLGSIGEQLLNLFFENRSKLCVPYCGSFEEFIESYTKKIGFESYGVETRLWYKGQTVPAFGSWNEDLMNQKDIVKNYFSFSEFMVHSIPECVLDQMILDSMFRKSKDSYNEIVALVCQDDFDMDEASHDEFILNLKARSDILKQDYNWFADQVFGAFRTRLLALYSRVSVLIHRLDYMGQSIVNFPSQEVVVLSQLHSHLLKMIETLALDPNSEEAVSNMDLSLEGMEWNYEDIYPIIKSQIAKEQRSQFKII